MQSRSRAHKPLFHIVTSLPADFPI
jgi:hypothetical protein